MSQIAAIRTAITDGTLVNRLRQCTRMMLTVVDEDDIKVLNLDSYYFSEWADVDALTIDSQGVNGIPWEMLEGSEGDMVLKWRAVYWSRARGYMQNRVNENTRVIDAYLKNGGSIEEDYYQQFCASAERAQQFLDRCLKNERYYAQRTDNFSL